MMSGKSKWVIGQNYLKNTGDNYDTTKMDNGNKIFK